MHRDDSVILFKDKVTNHRFCRLCVKIQGRLRFPTDILCEGYSCMSYPGYIKKAFDNTKHEIILSMKTCKVCYEKEKQCVGIDNCPNNIEKLRKFIYPYIQQAIRKYSNCYSEDPSL